MSDDIIKDNDQEFNQFVATEDDLRAITGNTLPVISSEKTEETKLPTAAKDGSPLVPVIFEEAVPVLAPKKDTHTEEVETDYKYVRDNLYTITERSVEALNNLSQIANASQHPRAFEVLSLLVKTIADAQKDLMTMHKDKVKIENEKAKQISDTGPEVVNNNLFVGTTTQLDEIIKKMGLVKKDA